MPYKLFTDQHGNKYRICYRLVSSLRQDGDECVIVYDLQVDNQIIRMARDDASDSDG